MEQVYVAPRPVWSEKQCREFSNKIGGFTPHRGEISCSGSACAKPGYVHHYNGGTIIEGEWYSGVFYPLPEIHSDYCFVIKCSWGMYLRHKNDVTKTDEIVKVNSEGKVIN